MAVSWGEAQIDVHVDGSHLPAEVRQTAITAGNVGGKSFNKTFGQRVRDGFKNFFGRFRGWFSGLWGKFFGRFGKKTGKEFSDGFSGGMKSFKLEFDKVSTDIVRQSKDVARQMRDVDLFGGWADDWGRFRQVFKELPGGQRELTNGFRQLSIEGSKAVDIFDPLLEDIGELRQVFDDAGDGARRLGSNMQDTGRRAIESGKGFKGFGDRVRGHNGLISRMRNGYDKLRISMKNMDWKGLWDGISKGDGTLRRHGSLWKRLSANTRQWILIIGAVIAGMEGLSALGAAAGAGLVVLGAGITSLVIGLGGAVAAFSVLSEDLKDVPKQIRPAAKAFQGLSKDLDSLKNSLAVEAFKGTENSWKSLGKTIRALKPALRPLGRVIRGLVGDFAQAVKPGRVAFIEITELLENSAPVFDRLMRLVGKLGLALIKAFNSPQVQRALSGLLGWLDKLITKFDAFVSNDSKMEEWFGHAESVFGAVDRLLGSIGRTLDALVTDESVARFTTFLDNIGAFVEGPGLELLRIFGELDLFGLASEALLAIGEALEPLAGPMKDLAEGINAVVKAGLETLTPVLKDIAEAIAPLVQGIADFMKENPKVVADAILGLAAAFVIFKGAQGIAGLAPKLKALNGTTKTMFGSWKDAKGLSGKITKVAGALAGLALSLNGVADAQNATDAGTGTTSMIESLLGGALTGGAIGGPPGAAVGVLVGLISNIIAQAFSDSEVQTNAQRGWDQIFDPNNFEGAGIGPFKKWVQDNFASEDGWLGDIGKGWQGFLDGIKENYQTFTDGMTTEEGWLGTLGASWKTSLDTMKEHVTLWWEDVKTGWTTFWEDLPGNVETFFTDTGTTISTGVSDWWTDFQYGLAILTLKFGQWLANLKTNTLIKIGAIGVSMGVAVSNWWNSFRNGLTLLWIKIGQWFTNLKTNILIKIGSVGTGIFNTVKGWANDFARGFQQILITVGQWVGRIKRKIGEIGSNPIGAIGDLISGNFASGGIVSGAQRILAGEDGPEAIVPLRRSLSRVDASVRGLSAIAQGKGGLAGGGVVGGSSRSVYVADGAIRIQGPDPRRAAIETVNRLVEVSA